MSETNKNVELKQKFKRYGIFALMGVLCLASIWMIFRPSEVDKAKEQQGVGFNTDIPDPNEQGIIGDKKDAYEQEQMKRQLNDRMQSLQGYADMLENSKAEKVNLNLGDELKQIEKPAPINNSVSAYRDINKTLGNFYEKPKDDPEKEEMKRKLEELEAKMQEKESKQNTIDEQLILMEKSYEMASKYLPQGQHEQNNSLKSKIENYPNNSTNGKTKVSPVRQIQKQTVSALGQNLSNEELFYLYDQPRNFGFNTMNAQTGANEKNTISAVIHDDQVVVDGQTTRLRLTEPLVAGSTLIPENTILTGLAKIQGERLDILISSIEYQGTIIPVEMVTYDTDGQKGIYIPGSLEMNAAKEIVANMGNSVGTSFTMTQSTGAQLASDLSKGAIQGVSAYMQKKIRQVKVTLKSGYRIMLMPKSN
ncbi:conjugative transposon protein TraM [Dysgonomonas sp. Marseille-P4677]|uniref:conjugative transposon protein TraM n=1 Tax=Dysgonomonas sp. Marseille-P4677 TaxID=2364790 RepID=UPI0019120393|nr:conjugative transposon protein TraM [Dysgonomonas sp. Marseille-P4677]MBK5720211.1 conjugative transposon protein TraM [Dysgonomonas sp. Marseille-P4677]